MRKTLFATLTVAASASDAKIEAVVDQTEMDRAIDGDFFELVSMEFVDDTAMDTAPPTEITLKKGYFDVGDGGVNGDRAPVLPESALAWTLAKLNKMWDEPRDAPFAGAPAFERRKGLAFKCTASNSAGSEKKAKLLIIIDGNPGSVDQSRKSLSGPPAG